MIGTAIMVVGLLFLALAGKQRERDAGVSGTPRSGFALGLVICIFSGIFSSMLNFSFVFGDEIRIRALAAGASNSMAANPIWSLTVTAAFSRISFIASTCSTKTKPGTFIAKGISRLIGFSEGSQDFSGTEVSWPMAWALPR